MRTILALCALGGFLALISFVPRSSVEFPKDGSVSELRAAIATNIRSEGAAKTYAKFKELQSGKDFDGSHSALHLFGEVLFEQVGAEGIATCDQEFNYGCFHGLVSAAIRATGLDAVAPLDASCATLGARGSTVCQHGIGHGILEYVGHDNLRDALDACGRTNQPDPLAGCTGGVFMEYNVPLRVTDDGRYAVAPRPLLDPSNPYAPCDTLSSTPFEAGCYQELPQWWHQVYEEDYARFGSFCAALPDVGNRNACVNGIGKVIPSAAGYDVLKARTLCEAVGTGDVYRTCIAQASWSFESNTGSHEEAVELCASLPEDDRTLCPS